MAGRTIYETDLTVEDETKHCDCCRENREHLKLFWDSGMRARKELEEIERKKENTLWKRFTRWLSTLNVG